MRLQIGDVVLYESQKDTTLILEDIRQLIEGLKQLASGEADRMGFDPIEPDFGLAIRTLTEGDTTVMVSSAAEIRADAPTGATDTSSDPSGLFDVSVWIDYTNQVDRVYGGYGPGLFFFVESDDIDRFADQLHQDLRKLGPYAGLP